MFLSVARLKRIAAGTSLKRLFIRTTSAASIAISVPAPIAIPMSALVSAGASLIPSPTIATFPFSFKSRMTLSFPSGRTPLFFACDEQLIGIIAVADVIKEDSPQAVKELQNMGIRVVMLTGDNERTAKAIGKQAGVDHVIAGVLPEGKESSSDFLIIDNGIFAYFSINL